MNVIWYSIKSIFFALIVAYISLVATLLSHTVAMFFGLGQPDHTNFIESLKGVLPFFLVTAVIAIVIGELFKKLQQSNVERFFCIFLYHYYFFYGLKMLEAFLSGHDLMLGYELITQILPAVSFSFLVTVLWKPKIKGKPFIEQLRYYFRNTSFQRWAMKFLIGWLIFLPVCYLTNWLISPFIEPFDVSFTYPISNRLSIKLISGLLFVITILPIFIRWNESKTSILFWIGFPIFLQIAVYPAVVEFWLPMTVRFPNLIQYTVISFVMSIFFVQLFYVLRDDEVIDDQFKWMY
ncbi:hypothetical protein AWH56_024385 [Anaerobacillus isosaccharinicus]|uniref:Uncharacterized protein n=1 Tax=Anaerobacillus isosaccharinicus TaxID=1532552 RepID=A0A1S2LEC2_9BACI|nr:hypothetical protein [Anaerobacillus isosaccharinicus]MBA5585958.1 hypothetical protein [Anaerobacillus isosaccharinicus]QOY35759.1 hypothetical protein AWH56_024385 [Anaerobacillus isosaccharinicus]